MLQNHWSAACRHGAKITLACAGVMVAWLMAGEARAQATGPGSAPASPALADFFRREAVSHAVLSPNGRHVAVLLTSGKERRKHLGVIDLANVSKSKTVAGYVDADIAAVAWVNDNQLVFSIEDTQSPLGEQPWQGLFSVDREGASRVRRLIKNRFSWIAEASLIADRELSVYHQLHSTLRDGTNDVIVARANVDGRDNLASVTLLRVDTVTGLARSISQGAPDNVFAWGLDAQGVPRIAESLKNGKRLLYWKATADAPAWQVLRDDPLYSDEGLNIVRVGPDRQVYAITRAGVQADTSSLVRVALGTSGEGGVISASPVLSLKGYDFRGQLVFNPEGQLLGVHYLSDARDTYWADARMKAIQAKVDELLPVTNNRIDCGACGDVPSLLVTSTSDQQPAVFRLYDVKTGSLQALAQSRPWIDPRTMATRDLMRYTARDGLVLPVHITRPRGVKGPAPAVVLVHGGPYVRGGEWRWYPESQFLASRGYVVIEPEFRGSTGFGSRLFRAGWKQWGLAMQDDIADAAQWAVKQGWADGQRMCIAGASYGGYATLMGLIKHSELFRCGVAWAGVSDIDLLYSNDWSDASDVWKTHGMPTLIGDRVKDAAQLATTSPLKRAAELRQPLLMAYGSDDRRVPLEHGTKLRDALRPHNRNVEFVVYPGEGHGFMLESSNIDFWTRVDSFLSQQLAAPPR